MLIFHEGLPGSGKSYEACINRIIPALLKGRKVFAYIEGLNYDKFAEVTGLPVERIKELLIQIEKSQVTEIYKHVQNDSLVIIDELQDFWPTGRQKLEQGITEFVTQHRHRGLDIIAMGQSHRDCHNLWKRRIDQLITFVKRDAIGMPSSYTWTTYKQVGEKFIRLLSGSGKYDPKYFGLYSSHTVETENTDTYTDKRANVLNNPLIKYGLPSLLVFSIFAVWSLWNFFKHPPVKPGHLQKNEVVIEHEAVQVKPSASATKPAIGQAESNKQPLSPDDYLGGYLDKYRPRLSAYVHNARKYTAIVEFLDDNNRVYERLNETAIMAFGYSIQPKPYGLLLISPKGRKHYVTPYPIQRPQGFTVPKPI